MNRNSSGPLRLGIVADFPEEGWASMDLVAEMASAHLAAAPETGVTPVPLTPTYRRFFGRISGSRLAWNLDRLVNRRWVLPRGVRRGVRRERPDVVFVVDHSYAQIVPVVQAEEVPVIVMCHDLDAFRDLIGPRRPGLRPWLLRRFARPILAGLSRADQIVTGSNVVRDELLARFSDRIARERVTTVLYGVAPEFLARSDVPWPFHGLESVTRPMMLHVGSTIPRKRIDVLLETLAQVARQRPGVTLVRVGGPLNESQRALAERLGVAGRIREMPRLSRDEIAELYRRADVVLVTSDAEGFGLPVAEALACGAAVVASDIPVLRETGGTCVTYATPGDAASFASAVEAVVNPGQGGPPAGADARLAWASRYRWDTFAAGLAAIARKTHDECRGART